MPVVDVYFSADVETDGPIPGPYSMLSFALVQAGRFDGRTFTPPPSYDDVFYRELRPVGTEVDAEALAVSGLDRERLVRDGVDPTTALTDAATWVRERATDGVPILVAYPLSFDWSWLYWYFTRFSDSGSPFEHSRCLDLRTAFALKTGRPVAAAGRAQLPPELRSSRPHTHDARDDAVEQAEILSRLFAWKP